MNATHVYANAGTYNVCLRVKRNTNNSSAPCVSEICKTITIPAPCNLVVGFNFATDPSNSRKINFTNTSTGYASGDSIKWTFGDGTISTDQNPSHVYATAGSYNVCLWIKKAGTGTVAGCSREYCKTVIVQDACNLAAYFSWQQSTANPLTVLFTNQSTNFASTDSITWTFGDGHSSNELNPTHTYTTAGTYNVCIRIKKNTTNSAAPCVREYCKTVVVNTPCNLQANFYWKADSTNTKSVQFFNTSGGFAPGDSIRWTFGDGTSSYDVDPVHLFAQSGTYTVCLRVKKNTASGTSSCVSEICKTVVITEPCNFTANFTSFADSAHSNNIHFINSSSTTPIPNASVKWTFGDGTSAYTWNADHVYTLPGTYQVCLRIQTSSNCVKEICKTITVVVPCDRQISYVSYPDQANPRRIYFNNTTPGSNTGAVAQWSFGDGTTATGWNVIHEYSTPGRYKVCLRVEFFAGCVKEKCDSITVNGNSDCLTNSRFTVTRNTNDCLRFKYEPVQKNTSMAVSLDFW